jgi:hypothetical protein
LAFAFLSKLSNRTENTGSNGVEVAVDGAPEATAVEVRAFGATTGLEADIETGLGPEAAEETAAVLDAEDKELTDAGAEGAADRGGND